MRKVEVRIEKQTIIDIFTVYVRNVGFDIASKRQDA